MVLEIRKIGGTSQLFSFPHETEKAFTLSVPGFQNKELKRFSFLLSAEANLSAVNGPSLIHEVGKFIR